MAYLSKHSQQQGVQVPAGSQTSAVEVEVKLLEEQTYSGDADEAEAAKQTGSCGGRSG